MGGLGAHPYDPLSSPVQVEFGSRFLLIYNIVPPRSVDLCFNICKIVLHIKAIQFLQFFKLFQIVKTHADTKKEMFARYFMWIIVLGCCNHYYFHSNSLFLLTERILSLDVRNEIFSV